MNFVNTASVCQATKPVFVSRQDPKPAVTIDRFGDKSSFVASIEDVLIQNRFCNLPHQNRLCTCSKTGFVSTLNQPLPNRLCACSKTGFVPTLNQLLQNRLCACSKTGFVPTLNQPLQNRLCVCSKTRFVPSPNLLHQNQLCAYVQHAALKPALHRHQTCIFILNKYYDCLRGKVWLSGFGFSSPYRGFNLSIWYYTGLYWLVLGQI